MAEWVLPKQQKMLREVVLKYWCITQIVVLANYLVITVACYPSEANSKNAVVVKYLVGGYSEVYLTATQIQSELVLL